MTETEILIRLLAHRATYLSQFLYPIVFYCIGQCVVVISRLTMRPGLARPCRGGLCRVDRVQQGLSHGTAGTHL